VPARPPPYPEVMGTQAQPGEPPPAYEPHPEREISPVAPETATREDVSPSTAIGRAAVPGSTLRAISSKGETHDNPSAARLLALLQDLRFGSEFFIVERMDSDLDSDRGTYIQAAYAAGEYIVERQAGPYDTHEYAVTPILERAHNAFTAWTLNLETRTELSWQAGFWGDPPPVSKETTTVPLTRTVSPTKTRKYPGGMPVKYKGGFAGQPLVGLLSTDGYTLIITEQGIRVWFVTQKGAIVKHSEWSVIRDESWEGIKTLNLASSQTTRANVPALAVFGPLGLAARREPGTLIAISYLDGDVFFTAKENASTLRVRYARLVDTVPAAAGKILFDGVPIGSVSSIVRGVEDIPTQIRALAGLHRDGILSDEEFSNKKGVLLSRL
jgi:hypothetical protein